jgi:hypothetical protein
MTGPRRTRRPPVRRRSGARFGSALLVCLALAVLGPLAAAPTAGATGSSSVSAAGMLADAPQGGDRCHWWQDWCRDDDDEKRCKPWQDWCHDDDERDRCHPWQDWCRDDDDEKDKRCHPWKGCDRDRAAPVRRGLPALL